MSPGELKELLQRRPFEPFRLLLTSGECVDVRHPEMAIVARSDLAVALRPKKGAGEQAVWYCLLHIVKASPLPAGTRRIRRHAA